MFPLTFSWDGEAMIPLPRLARLADERFVIGETYQLEPVLERSAASHAHEFAWLKEAWLQLPEDVADLYPTPEHLRKRALIKAGFYDEQIVDAGSNAAALRVAAAFRSREEFAHIVVRGGLVAIRTAKSQSRNSMKRAEFQASKDGILAVVSEMIGVTPEQLTREAGKAA